MTLNMKHYEVTLGTFQSGPIVFQPNSHPDPETQIFESLIQLITVLKKEITFITRHKMFLSDTFKDQREIKKSYTAVLMGTNLTGFILENRINKYNNFDEFKWFIEKNRVRLNSLTSSSSSSSSGKALGFSGVMSLLLTGNDSTPLSTSSPGAISQTTEYLREKYGLIKVAMGGIAYELIFE